mmetsp:Transcript_12062/g.34489  ORF Transcript_12062/g.34489 Transcript_12062/m.34489 type:complete len:233 (+) Transcript_12062:568-1266(+)
MTSPVTSSPLPSPPSFSEPEASSSSASGSLLVRRKFFVSLPKNVSKLVIRPKSLMTLVSTNIGFPVGTLSADPELEPAAAAGVLILTPASAKTLPNAVAPCISHMWSLPLMWVVVKRPRTLARIVRVRSGLLSSGNKNTLSVPPPSADDGNSTEGMLFNKFLGKRCSPGAQALISLSLKARNVRSASKPHSRSDATVCSWYERRRDGSARAARTADCSVLTFVKTAHSNIQK